MKVSLKTLHLIEDDRVYIWVWKEDFKAELRDLTKYGQFVQIKEILGE